MKVLIYVNKEKDVKGVILNNLKKCLDKNKIEYYEVLDESFFTKDCKNEFFAIFIIGGDGTILRRTQFANLNGIAIIGINAGKLGFLTEFEQNEVKQAVNLLINNELKVDKRATAIVKFNDKKYYALNDVVIQRVYEDCSGMTISVDVFVGNEKIDNLTGDGVIVSTPTGSTAYSLSAGGAILAPGINAFSVTPIAAHSLSGRTVVYSANSKCKLLFKQGTKAGLFIDGKMICEIQKGDKILVEKAPLPTIFLRKKGTSFFNRLSFKIKNRKGGVL